ncbi:MAG TPA: Ig-like domain-containing protein [Bosea sp. (in: a-proteobacteria)]|nr:Ig-like domain-containing protein [Bosea sp. (in: a-proteobacteria)]
MTKKCGAMTTIGVAAGGLLLGVSVAEACTANPGRGWSRGAGSGTITMAKGSKSCGGPIWVDPDARLPVTTLSLTSQPANGRVTIKGNSYTYSPKPGFSGQDSFGLSGSGKTKAGESVTLTGTMSVTIQ